MQDWYWEKWGLTDLPGHNWKFTTDMNLVWSNFQGLGSKKRFLEPFLTEFPRLIWRIYRNTTGNWHQIWIWFWPPLKGLRVQAQIFTAIFDWVFKEQTNLPLIASDWYSEKLGLTDLPGPVKKLKSYINLVLR